MNPPISANLRFFFLFFFLLSKQISDVVIEQRIIMRCLKTNPIKQKFLTIFSHATISHYKHCCDCVYKSEYMYTFIKIKFESRSFSWFMLWCKF